MLRALGFTMVVVVALVAGMVMGTRVAEAFPTPGPAQALVKLERNYTIKFKNGPQDLDKNGLNLECQIKRN